MKRTYKVLVSVAASVVLVVAVAAIVVHRWAQGSSSGTVTVGSPDADKTQASGPVAVHSSYFTASLPAGFTVKHQAEHTGAALLQLVALGGTNDAQQFAVTLNPLPAEGLGGSGDYHLRTSQTAAYAPFSPPGLPADAKAFRTTSGEPAFTVFWAHGSAYAEIALSTDSGASLDDLSSTFAQAISSWKWQ